MSKLFFDVDSVSRDLLDSLESRSLRVGVVGLGYVGLALAVRFANSGRVRHVVGFDIDPDLVHALNTDKTTGSVRGVEMHTVVPRRSEGRLSFSASPDCLAGCNVIFVCVPTPVTNVLTPDLSPLLSSCESIGSTSGVHPSLVVIESTIAPSHFDKAICQIKQTMANRCARENDTAVSPLFAVSPERENPGSNRDACYVPKLVGSDTPTGLLLAERVLSLVYDRVVSCRSAEVAIMAKLYENTYRAVNIALANEMHRICDELCVPFDAVLNAASTKPFGFTRFESTAGTGGHCIPVDPHYLIHDLRENTGIGSAIISDAMSTIRTRTHHVFFKITQHFRAHLESESSPSNPRLLVLGVSYKPGVDDVRNSPVVSLIELLQQSNFEVDFFDDNVTEFCAGSRVLRRVGSDSSEIRASSHVTESISYADYDAVIIGSAKLDKPSLVRLVNEARFVYDTKNATGCIPRGANVLRV